MRRRDPELASAFGVDDQSQLRDPVERRDATA
jgi:hypothetical protein